MIKFLVCQCSCCTGLVLKLNLATETPIFSYIFYFLSVGSKYPTFKGTVQAKNYQIKKIFFFCLYGPLKHSYRQPYLDLLSSHLSANAAYRKYHQKRCWIHKMYVNEILNSSIFETKFSRLNSVFSPINTHARKKNLVFFVTWLR